MAGVFDRCSDGFIGFCCKITQKLTDKKESAENERVLDHWRTEHDQLKLYDIDDDEDGGGEGHADSAPLKKARQRTPSTELYVYSADELARFEKRDMLAILSILMRRRPLRAMRKQNIGRASFIILEKLPTNKLNERVVTPEGVPRLFDLIKPKGPRSASAFYKGVRNTLVADNLDQANDCIWRLEALACRHACRAANRFIRNDVGWWETTSRGAG
ncbi:hypothetical protein EDD22DRAFT_1016303 [Suillus occidentalis]|nr:hypothetical protein EDD22DRAFT_1016303 [Suillus occidentalis]